VGQAHEGWIGVDFDGTLAEYDTWQGANACGKPIPLMVDRVKQWLAEGLNVRIVTARVYAPHNNAKRQMEAAVSLLAIQQWCLQHLGKILPITCVKDFAMIELWDDRCVQVQKNSGARVDGDDEVKSPVEAQRT
jgi:hypothetical protein